LDGLQRSPQLDFSPNQEISILGSPDNFQKIIKIISKDFSFRLICVDHKKKTGNGEATLGCRGF
jgi:hypothetical protein